MAYEQNGWTADISYMNVGVHFFSETSISIATVGEIENHIATEAFQMQMASDLAALIFIPHFFGISDPSE